MIYTSYFYAIRHMPRTMVPVSTAMSDPQWFHAFGNKNHIYIDKRGVINGVRAESFVPGPQCEGLCHGPGGVCECTPGGACLFLTEYRRQLEKMSNDELDARYAGLANAAAKILEVAPTQVDLCFMFHEKPDNPCSERVPFTEWLRRRGYRVQEFDWRAAQAK